MFARWLIAFTIAAVGLSTAPAQGLSGYSVEIDLEEQVAYLIYGSELVLTSPISSGRQGHHTKRGTFKVIQKERQHHSNLYGKIVDSRGRTVVADADSDMPVPRGATFVAAPMPYFIRYNGAEGMHAGVLPGYPASHGCVRLPEANAIAFFNAVEIGTPVTVFGTTPQRRSRQQEWDYMGERQPRNQRAPRYDRWTVEPFLAPRRWR